MEGKLGNNGKNYEWWAGPANPDAEGDFCVHCRREEFGVTKYFDKEPDRASAEKIASELAPLVENLQ